jgi:hypothetical protein
MRKIIIKLYTIIKFPNFLHRTLIPDTFQAKLIYSFIEKYIHFIEHRKRATLASKFNKLSINPKIGYGKIQSNQLDEIFSLSNYAKSLNWIESVHGKKKPFLQSMIFNYGDLKALDKLITSEEIVGPIANYLGQLPVFNQARIFYSPNTTNYDGVSQSAHLDSEDYKQIKCWIPLDDISIDSGPLNVLPADLSRELYNKLSKKKNMRRSMKLEDSLLSKYVNLNDFIKCIGNVGDVFFTDTNQCYHFGSRKAKKPRLVLMLHYFSTSSIEVPFLIRKKTKFLNNEETLLCGYSSQLFSNKYRINS